MNATRGRMPPQLRRGGVLEPPARAREQADCAALARPSAARGDPQRKRCFADRVDHGSSGRRWCISSPAARLRTEPRGLRRPQILDSVGGLPQPRGPTPAPAAAAPRAQCTSAIGTTAHRADPGRRAPTSRNETSAFASSQCRSAAVRGTAVGSPLSRPSRHKPPGSKGRAGGNPSRCATHRLPPAPLVLAFSADPTALAAQSQASSLARRVRPERPARSARTNYPSCASPALEPRAYCSYAAIPESPYFQ